ncbi:MAG TPA: acetyltransferase [Burkholderiaceae bacterium]|jgi:hypothetical protein|nr:acetyltransferase [Burkholderiaceae bacterium]
MSHYDVFNGDADGICALHQLRLVKPLESILVTGTKRDIALLERVPAGAGDSVTVLDISLDTNRQALLKLLAHGVLVEYFDHHACGEIPRHDHLHAVIDTTPTVCTSMLVDRELHGQHRLWAAVGAFGDNFFHQARKLAALCGLSPERIAALEELGNCLNYNAYGDCEADLLVHPRTLYATLHRYSDPFAFMESEPVFAAMRTGRSRDLELARASRPDFVREYGRIYILPDAAWSRRVRGAFGNEIARAFPEQATAILTHNVDDGYSISVRAPLHALRGADRVCTSFPSGGGRPAAGGINHLPKDRLSEFLRVFEQVFSGG